VCLLRLDGPTLPQSTATARMNNEQNRREIWARPGQRVVYVDDRRAAGTRWYPYDTMPKLGSIYTIREVIDCRPYGYAEHALYLVEIVNVPRHRYASPSGPMMHELAFRVSRFRPVRTTNIDVFLKMLEPATLPVSESAFDWLEKVGELEHGSLAGIKRLAGSPSSPRSWRSRTGC
jgi:hypothetical protein